MPESVENLEIWKQAIKLVKTVYQVTNAWPPYEQFGLIAQVSRAAPSVLANIAEGIGRGSRREIARFGRVALGSLYELDTLLVVAMRLGYSAEAGLGKLRTEIATLAKGISNFVRYQETRT